MNRLHLEDHIEKATKIGHTVSDENMFPQKRDAQGRHEPTALTTASRPPLLLGQNHGRQKGLHHPRRPRLRRREVLPARELLLEVR